MGQTAMPRGVYGEQSERWVIYEDLGIQVVAVYDTDNREKAIETLDALRAGNPDKKYLLKCFQYLPPMLIDKPGVQGASVSIGGTGLNGTSIEDEQED